MQLSGRQKCVVVLWMKCRRELEEQRAKEAYFQKTLEGQTVCDGMDDDALAGGEGDAGAFGPCSCSARGGGETKKGAGGGARGDGEPHQGAGSSEE